MFYFLSLAKSPRTDILCLNSADICRVGLNLLSDNGPLLWEGDLKRCWNCPCWLDPRVWGKVPRRPLSCVYLLGHPIHIWKTNHRFESLTSLEETVIIWKLIHRVLNWNLLLLVIWCDDQRNWLRFLWLSESWVSLPVCMFIFTWLSFFLFFFFLIFWPCLTAFGINHCTTRELPIGFLLINKHLLYHFLVFFFFLPLCITFTWVLTSSKIKAPKCVVTYSPFFLVSFICMISGQKSSLNRHWMLLLMAVLTFGQH